MSDDNYQNRLERIETLLDTVSPSMCLAKWFQTTLYLQNGFNHSCHHPTPHKIPVQEIKVNYKSLHNTGFKKEQMQKMLDGKRPAECEYCWNIEDLPGKHISDRIYKSATTWAMPYLGDALDAGTSDIEPKYLEISFSNVCNFKCGYCSPDLSSKWYEEVTKHGGYPTSSNFNSFDWFKQTGKMPIQHNEENPYVDAFWQWWPELYPKLHTLRLTGGEPLLSKDVWRLLDYIEANPRKDLTFCINTNLCVGDEFIDRLIAKINAIQPHVKEVQIFTSGEATGEQIEYMRYGMDYDQWRRNLEKVLQKTNCIVATMTTVNLTNVSTYADFIRELLDLRGVFNPRATFNKVQFMTNYLRYPEFLALPILDDDTKHEFKQAIEELIEERSGDHYNGASKLSMHEVDQLNRMIEHMYQNTHAEQNRLRKDLVAYVDEYDKRRGTNFLETYPELERFYNLCKEA